MSLMGGAMCVALIAYGKLSQKISTKRMVDLSLTLCILAGLLLLLSGNLALLCLSMIAMAIGVALSYTAIMAAYANTVQLSYQGVAMGLTLSVMAIAWTLTGSFARVLFSYSHGLSSVLIIVGFSLTLLIFQKPFKHNNNQSTITHD